MTDPGNQDLDSLWDQVLHAWQDSAAHDRFVQACHDSARLGYAAARYRSLLDDMPEQSAAALAQLELRRAEVDKRMAAITILATQALDASRTDVRQPLERWLRLAAAGLLVGALLWVVYALTR